MVPLQLQAFVGARSSVVHDVRTMNVTFCPEIAFELSVGRPQWSNLKRRIPFRNP